MEYDAATRGEGPRGEGPRSEGPRSEGPRSEGPRSETRQEFRLPLGRSRKS